MPRPLNVKLIDPPLPHFTDSFPLTTQHECGNWPRPFAVGDYAAVAMVLPFALDENLKGKIWVAVINIVIGLCIASLLSSVLSRTVVDGERSWQPQLLISSWFSANGAGLADVASVHRSGQHWS